MDKTNKKLCKEFESEMWLFLDHSLGEDRKRFWKNHLNNCQECSLLLKTSAETIEQYNQVPLGDMPDDSYEKIVNTITADNDRTEHLVMPQKENRSLFEIFGFYKLAFGGTILVAALVLIFITFFKNPELPEIKTDLPRQVLDWDDNLIDNRLEKVGDQIYSLRTDDWDIYLIRRNKKENWSKALSSIQKQIRQMQKEVASTSM